MIASPMDQMLITAVRRYAARQVNMRPTSSSQLAYTVAALNRYAGKSLTVRECTEDLLCDFLSHRVATCSKATARRDRGNVLTVLRFAKTKGWIPAVPDVPTIRQEHVMPRAWTLQEFEAMLAAALALSGNMRHLPIRRAWWYGSLLLFLYESGLRIRSAVSLQTRDVWLDRKAALVRAATDKTWADQLVTLSDTLVEMLREGIGTRQLIWPYPWDRRKLWLDLAEIREMAGLPQGREYGFHRIRKTHATQAVIVAGWEAARKSLGHSTEAMTRRYVDVSQVHSSTKLILPSPQVG